jgi:16S rRNA (guanine1516-N2)-methyltransferase
MDPMYPEKKKSAATKKEMKALQNLVGPDRDSENLLQAAFANGCLSSSR